MDDKFIKYTKVYALSFLLFLCIPLFIIILFYTFYGFSTLISSRPADIIIHLLILSMPFTVFSAVYYIFFRRTKSHPAKAVRIISYFLFIAAFLVAIFLFILDLTIFIDKRYNTIEYYHSFSLSFLAGNVALLFLTAIVQAFTTEKEKDWLER